MARYIDADKEIEEIDRASSHGLCQWSTFGIKALIDRQPTADVVPKSEVEELIRENESLAKTVNEASELIRKLRSKVKKSKTEVAREIFEEIESMLVRYTFEDSYGEYISTGLENEFVELKKKYVEEIPIVRNLAEEAVDRDIINHQNEE